MKYYLASNEDLKGVYVKYYLFISGSSIQDITISLTSIPNFSSFPGWRAWEEPEPSTRSEPAEATAVGLSEPGDWEAQTEGKKNPSPLLSSCPSSTWTSSTGQEIASYNESCFYICVRCALYIKYSLQMECNLNCNLCKSYSAPVIISANYIQSQMQGWTRNGFEGRIAKVQERKEPRLVGNAQKTISCMYN